MDNNKSHKYFLGVRDFSHQYKPAVGILFVNLGTPDAPTRSALKTYLSEFLSDPRIIELPRFLWQLLLQGVILFSRPPKIAKLYQSIWTSEGSPLLVITKKQVEKLKFKLAQIYGTPHHIAIGMRYGNPSIGSALRELKEKSCSKIIILPMFGQYSSATVGSAMDAVFDELKTWRWVPEIRSINQFHDHPLYIKSLADNIKKHWEKHGRSKKLLMSFHGMPLRYILAGDPYHCQCHKTARLVSEELGISKDEYYVSFQSQFGKEEWIKPATDKTLEELAKNGLKSVDVICPGFIADCLETLEEIEEQNKEIFLENGGEKYSYIEALNDGDSFIHCLSEIIKENAAGWMISKDSWDQNLYEENARRTDTEYNKKLANQKKPA